MPQRGQAGFPLTWAGDKELFIRPEKKYPNERWPTTPQVEPKVELLKDGKNVANVNFYHSYAYPGNYSTFRDSSVFTGLKEISRMVMLTPNMQLGDRESEQMLTIKATAGNSVTAPLLLRRKSPEGNDNSTKLQRVVVKWSVGDKNRQELAQQTVYNRSILPNKTGILKFNTQSIEDPYEGTSQGSSFQKVVRVILRDSSGKLLNAPPINKEGEYQFKIEKAGRYTIHLDVMGPDGKPLHQYPDFRKTSQVTSNFSHKITVNVRETSLISFPAGRIPLAFGQWQPTAEADVWQRKIEALTSNPIIDLKFAIRPKGGYKAHPKVSWLAPQKSGAINNETSSHETMQYYRVLLSLPEMSSRQMNVYNVEVTGRGIDEQITNQEEVLR